MWTVIKPLRSAQISCFIGHVAVLLAFFGSVVISERWCEVLVTVPSVSTIVLLQFLFGCELGLLIIGAAFDSLTVAHESLAGW